MARRAEGNRQNKARPDWSCRIGLQPVNAGVDAAPPICHNIKRGCERGGPWYIRARTRSFGLEVVLSRLS